MEFSLLNISVILLAYLTGSIPSSVWIGKMIHGIDVREHGSGNAGATNTMRVLGVKTGVPVLLIDMFKGWLAARYASIFNLFPEGSNEWMNISIILGVIAVFGHIFPVFAGFRGGKGVASIFGVLLALALFPTLCAGGVFFVFLLLFRFVSLGSVAAGLSFPLFVILVFQSPAPGLRYFSLVVALLIILTHRKNIRRLIKGEESKAEFLFRKRK